MAKMLVIIKKSILAHATIFFLSVQILRDVRESALEFLSLKNVYRRTPGIRPGDLPVILFSD